MATKMNYPVSILKLQDLQTYQLSVPDLPGCQITSNSISQGLAELGEAIAAHLTILAEYGESIPHAKSVDHYVEANSEQNVIWAVIEFDITPYLGRSHKINVTLPELLIKQIDDKVSKSVEYKTRSGFIAKACVVELNKTG